jgi:putative nucleotidyltransferase with HDIG domain
MIRIRDALHGTVQLSSLEERLLDTQQMQRLRGIRQLSMAYLVYPGANHTRFEHSIGTLYLAGRICKEIGLDEDIAQQVKAAALLHDIGHCAFSHEGESVVSRFLGSHEKIGEEIITHGDVADILSENYSPSRIARLPKSQLGDIISSDIGADRMDYLLRDSHYTGVAYGVIDSDWLCSSFALSGRKLFLSERGLAAAESLLVARFTMFSSVYFHKTVRIASRMLKQAMSKAIQDGTIEPQHALLLSDSRMLDALCGSKEGKKYALGIISRRLYKKAFSFPASLIEERQVQEIEEELSGKCGCDVLIDLPHLSAKAEIEVMLDDGKAVPIAERSELVRSLSSMQKSRLEALVICDEKNAKKVSLAAKKLF